MSFTEHFQKMEELLEELLDDKFRLMCLVYDSVDVFKGHKAVAFKEEHPIAIIIKDYYKEKKRMEEDRLFYEDLEKNRKEVEDILKELLDEDELKEFMDQK